MDWAVGGAIEHGSFMMALAAVALTCLVILLALSGVIAYIRVRSAARSIATEVASSTAAEVAEKAANEYLQAEIPAIIEAYGALGQNSVKDELADEVAENQEEEG